MNAQPCTFIMFLATLVITPVAYPSQASNSYSALSSSSSSSVQAQTSGTQSNFGCLQTSTKALLSAEELFRIGYNIYAKDPRKAELAASKGNAMACYILGRLLEDGTSIPKDLPRALSLYKQAAAEGQLDALVAIGRMYYKGHGVNKDSKTALDYFEQAAKLGNVEALNRLGSIFFEGKIITQDFKRARAYFQKAAVRGSASAMHALGVLYASGTETEQNWELALKYLHQAAQKGYALSQAQLADLYFTGTGTKRNLTKAFTFLLAAASNDHRNSQAVVYRFLQDGIYMPRDTKKAAEFFENIKKAEGSAAKARTFITQQGSLWGLSKPRFPMPIVGEICSICYNPFELDDELTILPCDHCFCKQCITQWITDHNTCPCCRRNGITCDQFKVGIASTQA